MSFAPTFRGQVRMPYTFKYVMVFTGGDELGTVEAFFCSKTIADKCCNELNATIGEGKELWVTRKIFPDEPF